MCDMPRAKHIPVRIIQEHLGLLENGVLKYCVCTAVFHLQFAKTGQMLKASFEHAHHLQVQTCFGTETPLSYPAPRTGMIPLNLYYSKTRNDHFLTATKVLYRHIQNVVRMKRTLRATVKAEHFAISERIIPK